MKITKNPLIPSLILSMILSLPLANLFIKNPKKKFLKDYLSEILSTKSNVNRREA